jgi:hypothetical protein
MLNKRLFNELASSSSAPAAEERKSLKRIRVDESQMMCLIDEELFDLELYTKQIEKFSGDVQQILERPLLECQDAAKF